LREKIVGFFEGVEHVFVSVAIIVAPWLADLVVAGLAARNVQQILSWPAWIAFLVGAGLEGLGMSTAGVWLRLRRYNATRGLHDPLAPAGLAAFIVVLQFAGSIILTLLSTVQDLQIYAIVAIPVLGGGGTICQMLNDDHNKRLADQAERKAEAERQAEFERRRAERRAAKAERSAAVQEQERNTPETFQLTPEFERVVQAYEKHPGAPFRTIAEELGRPLASVHRDVNALLDAGVLEKRNGHGIMVMGALAE